MISLSAAAAAHLRDLTDHYVRLDRREAVVNLRASLALARDRIESAPDTGLLAPRPYPKLTRTGRLWLKEGRYWFAYTTAPPAIIGIYWDQADIPGRL